MKVRGQMGQLIQLGEQAKVLQAVFTTNMQAMAKMVPRTMGDPSRLLRIAYNSVAYDPLLVETSKTQQGMASIVGGVMEALKLGLTIGGPMQEASLVPFKNHGVLEATLIPGFMGYRNILDRSKSVIDLHPRAVYANDEFDVNFGSSKIHHKPYYLRKPPMAEPGPLVAVYAIAHLARGGIQIEVMPVAEIEEHRARSRAKDSGPWKTDYVAMALKTVIRKIAKYLPKSSEILMRALDLDMKADLGQSQEFDLTGIVFDEAPPASKQVGSSRLETLKKTLAAPAAGNGGQTLPAAKAGSSPTGGVVPPVDSAAPPAATPPAEAPHPAGEEGVRELDEALGGEPTGIGAIGGAYTREALDAHEREPGDEQPDDNAALDAELAAKDGGMTPVGALFDKRVGTREALAAQVDAVRKRAEDLAKSRKGR